MDIGAKIYYDITTGNVITLIGERQGGVKETTKIQDMKSYIDLHDKDINEVDFIELEYGAYGSTFDNAKSYIVNLETKELKVEYYKQTEIDKQIADELASIQQKIDEQAQQDKANLLHDSVEKGLITAEQFKLITGIDYI